MSADQMSSAPGVCFYSCYYTRIGSPIAPQIRRVSRRQYCALYKFIYLLILTYLRFVGFLLLIRVFFRLLRADVPALFLVNGGPPVIGTKIMF